MTSVMFDTNILISAILSAAGAKRDGVASCKSTLLALILVVTNSSHYPANLIQKHRETLQKSRWQQNVVDCLLRLRDSCKSTSALPLLSS